MDVFDFVSGVFEGVSEENIKSLLDKSDTFNAASTVPNGGEFTFCGIPFIRLGEEQGGILCITKQNIFTSRFNNNDNNNYRESILRRTLLEEFLPHLDDGELLPFAMDLRVNDETGGYGTCTDYVGILTEDLYRKYKQYIRINGATWLCTPYSVSRSYPWVRYVNSSGLVNYGGASGAGRCRPACIFKKSF